MTLVTIIAFIAGFGLHWALSRGKLPIMKLTIPQSVALWVVIFAGLCAVVAVLQWAVEAGAL